MSRFQPTPAYRIFLDLLVKARTDQGVTQDELATRLELSPAQIEAFESGARQIDLVQTMEWCAALGASFSDFMVKIDAEITAQIPNAPATDAPAPATNAPATNAPATDADTEEGGAA